jgi:hypothetical protein
VLDSDGEAAAAAVLTNAWGRRQERRCSTVPVKVSAATSFVLGDDLRGGGRGEAAALRAYGGAVTRGKVAARRTYRRGVGWRPGVEGDGELALGEVGRRRRAVRRFRPTRRWEPTQGGREGKSGGGQRKSGNGARRHGSPSAARIGNGGARRSDRRPRAR